MNRPDFFQALRKNLFVSHMLQTQVDGIEAILDEAEKRNTPMRHLAYILATTYHETAKTMQPIEEYGKGKKHAYGKPGKYGQSQHGRGFVQLTWDANYERADKELKLNGALLKNFNLAMDLRIATQILFQGMEEGWFTGKKMSHYLDGALADYVGARRIINGTDKAAMIAGYANEFASCLILAHYGTVSSQVPSPEPVPATLELSGNPGLLGAIIKFILSIIGAKK